MARIWLSDLPAMSGGSALLQAGNGYNPYRKAFIDTRNPLTRALVASVTVVGTTQSLDVASGLSTASTGVPLAWITAPLKVDAAVPAKPVLCNVWAAENAADANVGIRLRLAEFIAGTGEGSVFLTSTTNSAELSSLGIMRWETSNPTATTVEAGNRLVIRLDQIALDTTGISRLVTMDYDGPTEAADGDTYFDINVVMRPDQSQLAGGSTAIMPGFNNTVFQQPISALNLFLNAGIIASNTTTQALLDNLGSERDAN